MKKYILPIYINLVNDKNKESIERLNNLVDQMNEIFKNPDSINEDNFRKTINEMFFLVYGNDHIKI